MTLHGIAAAHRVAELLGRLAEPALVDVADHDPRALLDAALRGREADAGARGRGDEHRLAREQAVARAGTSGASGGIRRTFGSGGRPRTRSPMTLRWIWFEPP